MVDEEEIESFKDISDLKRELEGIKLKKDVSTKELYSSVQKLSQTISDMLEIFGAAAEQLKIEEKEYELNAKKHDLMISKLDKLLDQNKTIAEGMVALVDMFKEKFHMKEQEREEQTTAPFEEEGPSFKSLTEQPQFTQAQWQPKPEPVQRAQPIMAPPIGPGPVTFAPSSFPTPEFEIGMPPMQPSPSPDFDFPEETPNPEEAPKKKGLFGMFKK